MEGTFEYLGHDGQYHRLRNCDDPSWVAYFGSMAGLEWWAWHNDYCVIWPEDAAAAVAAPHALTAPAQELECAR
ncbi:hypothetical protein [Tropicimonas sp. IMCC34011]|uniref:hypothetical protein n=1 Tax=Tropicimonas sp. IMCC34011 TaxID=2248759 RepID=UPI000E25C600|nr:hypothetical protein [Tropicimonas sp. IMCC34011]